MVKVAHFMLRVFCHNLNVMEEKLQTENVLFCTKT